MAERKVILTIAPTGGMGRKTQNESLPTQPQEIADDVARCWEAGASVAALHARRPDDQATCSPEVYGEMNRLIRERCDIIINNSTGGGPDGDMYADLPGGRGEVLFDERIKATEAGAEMCTFDPQTMSIRLGDQTLLMDTSFDKCVRLAERMQQNGIKPEWEVYGPADLVFVRRLIEMGYDTAPYYINIVLGTDKHFSGTWPYEPKYLQFMVDELPADAIFGVTAIGPAQLPATVHGMVMGGHMRVGLEDNLYYRRGELATNLMLVERAVRIMGELDLEPASPSEAREIMGLPVPSN